MGTTEHHSSSGHGHGPQINHETTDVNLTGITRLAIVSLLVIAGILGFVVGFEKLLAHFLVDKTVLPTLAERKPGEDRIPATPVLVITDEPGALRQLRQEESQILDNYAWVDKNQGVVRIPIAKAMELVAKNPGLLAPQGAAPVTPASPPGAQTAPTVPQSTGHATTPQPKQ